ncbi:iron-containing hydrogenase, putative [Trypanosoma brucei gambiense DAL972]|uniref:Iron-containing hydrogenase, putative n=1 Tax=Trypanosoma brucei gambiense (strain MHOM/CI/86/DAL972) TaxID=679716 RepID=D0A4K1_TRYB9|nr:iron-containing hydrogenase, putative [Trypanosoma brucei gambiense DAL972]CBH16195.1 iron-containing hydrogenase, putative [Trypanosoma brucei gambiense DAL972]|eukprot:XP_011778459.1 iron-containing hydrogenase, putative [Trypanosoma brucei gambiense DAL972]
MSANNFSASLMLAGMDYIAPSEACILPTKLQGGTSDDSVKRHGAGNEAVKITLQDCLACSGCVTTAETILITSQSREELLKDRALDPTRPFFVTISDQSAASIAAFLKTDVQKAFHIVSGFFRAVLNARYVSDLHWALRISVEKTAEEYCRRVRCERERLPLIVSACPGWVCYCEKQGAAILPLLCPVMSPQGIAGCYSKTLIPQMCHVSVQPCFDRKLEAARDGSSVSGERYTDFVLSTQELLDWMLEVDPSLPWQAPLDSDLEPLPILPPEEPKRSFAATMEGSGGYHRYAMHRAARELHGLELAPRDIHYEMKRNANHHLTTSPSNPGEVFCVAYGFQQIQNTVRGIKRKLASVASYTFIELMACPEGCLNGGGQARNGTTQSHVETTAAAKSAFISYISGSQPTMEVRGGMDGTSVASNRDVGDGPPPFSLAAFAEVEKQVGSSLWSCTFTDRQREFEATLNTGGVHSLKW